MEKTQAREGIPSLDRALSQELDLEPGQESTQEPGQEPQPAVETAGKDRNDVEVAQGKAVGSRHGVASFCKTAR